MKKRTLLLALTLAALVLVGYAAAAGGDASDPLLSLDFLRGRFLTETEAKIESALDAADKAVLDEAGAQWTQAVARAEAAAGTDYLAVLTETRTKSGDLLSGTTGLQVVPLAGSVTVNFTSGAVVDVTDGTEVASGSTLALTHRYLVAEDTAALFRTDSETAVLSYCGGYSFTPSTAPDYNAMADALKALALFRGSTVATGSGYELERTPTRAEALTMLIRLLGEEDAALACTAENPYADVPAWFAPYAAYAYEKGYSNGIGKDWSGRMLFGTQNDASALMYTEFLLRALGYSSTATTDISDALERALASGVLTAGECSALRGEGFLRADVVYLSYYALSASASDGRMLSRKLSDAGVFTTAAYRAACERVTSERIG